jgi:hypothetical protein
MGEAARNISETLGGRLNEACAIVGSKKVAAEIMGVSEDMVYRYCRALTKPPFMPLAALSRAAGIRMEWLAFGDGPMRTMDETASTDDDARELDSELLGAVITLLEQVLSEMALSLNPITKGKVIPLLYQFACATPHEADRQKFTRGLLKSL